MLSPPTLDAAFLDGLINEEPLLGQNPIEQQAANAATTKPSHVHFASKSASKGFAVGPTSSTKQSNLKMPTNDDEVELVAASEVTGLDILCVRGTNTSPANTMFRQLVSSNAKCFGTLTADEKEKFATNLCNQLRDRSHRFLRPRNKGAGMYEHLNDEQSFKKVHHALSVCRSKDKGSANAVSVASLSESYDFTQVPRKPPPVASMSNSKAKAPPTKKQKTAHLHKPLGPMVEKKFDDVAKAAIATLLSRQEFVAAMEKNWGDDKDRRRQICEEQMLFRYRNAALNGVSVQQFSDRLLPVLLAAVRENNGSNNDGDHNKENLKEKEEEEDTKEKANGKD